MLEPIGVFEELAEGCVNGIKSVRRPTGDGVPGSLGRAIMGLQLNIMPLQVSRTLSRIIKVLSTDPLF